MRSKVRLFGHPVHPMLIAYPVAFYTGTLVGFVVFAATDDVFWLRLTIALNLAGIVAAAVAAIPGVVDWIAAIPRRTEASRTGLIHLTLNVIALALFTLSFLLYRTDWGADSVAGTREPATGIVLASVGVLATIVAGFQGWRLVQDHHVGVSLTPEQAQVDEIRARRRIA